MCETWAVSFYSEKQCLLKAKEKLPAVLMRLSCQLFFEWLRNCVQETIKLWPKYRETKLKSIKKRNFLALKDIFLTFPGCCLTLVSSLDVVRVRFASWSVYRVLLVNDLPNLYARRFSSFTKVECSQFSSSKVRCCRFLGRLVRSFFPFYFVVLKNFKIYLFFNWYFVMPSWSTPAYFNFDSSSNLLMFLTSRLLCIFTQSLLLV